MPWCRSMVAVGTSATFTTATVHSGDATDSASSPAAPRRSKPRSRSAPPGLAWASPVIGDDEIRMSEVTGPPFCANPVWSIPAACRPSRCAAICMIRDAVTTPVPPIPGMRMTVEPDHARCSGSGRDRGGAGNDGAAAAAPGAVPGDDEGRALPFDAGHVEIAAALMDRHLRAELGVDVDQRHAGGLLGAVSAALADPAVDPHRLAERRALTPVAQPPFFGRGGVMVDERGDTRRTGQLVLSPSSISSRCTTVAIGWMSACGELGRDRAS